MLFPVHRVINARAVCGAMNGTIAFVLKIKEAV